MTLMRSQAWCLPCGKARTISNVETHSAGAYAVKIGTCGVCAEPLVRIVHEDLSEDVPCEVTHCAPEMLDDGSGYLWDAPVGTLLSMIAGSVDIQGPAGPAWEYGQPRWADVIASKAAAAHFDGMVALIGDAGLTMPIVMWDRELTGEYIIGNGHHRLVAALLLGLKFIPVLISQTGDFHRFEDTHDEDAVPAVNRARILWSIMGPHLSGEALSPRGMCQGVDPFWGCECGSGCGEDASQPSESPQETTAQREDRECQERADAWQHEAQCAAADALWALRQGAQEAAQEHRARAVNMRAEAARLLALAVHADDDARIAEDRRDAMGALYRAAREGRSIKIANGVTLR